jgi:hypothetical protein
MFNRIWKAQIQKPKGGATIWQPKEKMKPDKRTNCKEKLMKITEFWEDYAEEMRNARTRAKSKIIIQHNLDDIPEETCCDFIDFVKLEVNTSGRFKQHDKVGDYVFYVYNDSGQSDPALRFSSIILLQMLGSINQWANNWLLLIHLYSNDESFLDGFTKNIIEMIQRQFGE